MTKRTPTQDVFDQLTESDESVQDAGAATEIPQDPEAPVADTTVPGGRRRVVAAVVGVLLIGLVGLSGWLGLRVKRLDDTAAAGQTALEAARAYAVTLTTLNANDIDKHYHEALDGATGEFKSQYGQGSAQLRQVLIDNQATGRGIVIDAAVKAATKTSVEVLLFVDQSITNAANPSPRIDRNRVQMTMQLVDDRWLAAKVELI